jgi:hypothetical protein
MAVQINHWLRFKRKQSRPIRMGHTSIFRAGGMGGDGHYRPIISQHVYFYLSMCWWSTSTRGELLIPIEAHPTPRALTNQPEFLTQFLKGGRYLLKILI